LSFGLLLLEFIHLVHFVSTLEVDIFGSNARLFVELDIHRWLVTNQDRSLQVEMQDYNELVRSTGLVKEVFYIREDNVNFLALG